MTIFLSFLFAALNTWAAVVFRNRAKRHIKTLLEIPHGFIYNGMREEITMRIGINNLLYGLFVLLAIVCFFIGLFEVLN